MGEVFSARPKHVPVGCGLAIHGSHAPQTPPIPGTARRYVCAWITDAPLDVVDSTEGEPLLIRGHGRFLRLFRTDDQRKNLSTNRQRNDKQRF
jgi:hypothetical protein